MSSFTQVSGFIFTTYLATNNKLIGMISFNCASAVLFAFKSVIFIDPYGYKNVLN